MLDNIGDADIETAMPGYFEKTNRLGDLFGNIYAFAQLSYSVDTENTKALDVIERMEAMIPDLSVVGTRFAKWAASVADQIPEGVSDEYGFHISDAVRKSEYMLGDEMERVIALMKNTGSGAWSRLQDVLTSSLTMELDGVETPLFQLRNMAYDPSPEIRKKAYEAELGAYPQIEKSSAASLNAIKGEVIALSKLRGYGSPLEMTLMNSRMDRETLDSMLEAIYEYLPVFRKYLRKKAQMLGHGAGLPFYDLFAPLGGAGGKYGFEDARRFIVESFATFSGELSEFADRAFEGKWIDAKIRKGKVGGAFCYNIHGIKESRIMSNFSGAFSDVTTLAHELGHGYHGECLKDAPQVNSDYPMPLAETASIFCESIAMDHAMEIADGKEKIAILEHGLMEATQVVVDILGRYIFETGLFEKRSTSSVPVDELKNMMVDAQKQSYGDGLDENLLHPYMWACKPHYYMPETNFYNFPYTFGLLFAKGLYAMYLEEGGGLSPNTKNSFLKPEGTT
jgi:pepF/M3 family oligoendopeptidase